MDDSLSIVVPARNAEATLAGQIHHLLDLLPDLTSRFEILVVDDGSSDHTVEIARELAQQYPQIRLIAHPEPRGHDATIQTGITAATSSTVLVQEDFADVSPTDLRRLWSLRHDSQLVLARTQRKPGMFDEELVERLSTWGTALRNLARRASPGGIQMIRRDGAQALAGYNAAVERSLSIEARTIAPTARP